MLNLLRSLYRTARKSRGGFTLVELLVVIGIIAILAGVALGPITNGIKQAKHNAAMQQGRQIGQVEFSYATDNTANGNAYPAAATSESIANNLISASYVSDPSIFCVAGAAGGQTVATASGTTITLASNNITWNFTVLSTNTTGGITSTASDLIPLVYFSGQTVTYPVPTGGASLVLSLTAAPFGQDGVAVFYKGNNATYLKAGTSGTPGTVANFISVNCTDTTSYTTAVP
jgi:prepilin-type N-terminal cleavage/methylation domain-containing protein